MEVSQEIGGEVDYQIFVNSYPLSNPIARVYFFVRSSQFLSYSIVYFDTVCQSFHPALLDLRLSKV